MEKTIKLTGCQQKAKEEIIEFLDSSDKDYYEHLLVGYAGTGKSFMLGQVLEKYKHLKIIACTISHAAKNVLQANTPDYVQCLTLAQGLNLRQTFVKGKEKFVKNANSKTEPPVSSAQILIIDECSMIDDEQQKFIREGLSRYGKVKVIYSGDSAQLPPVKEDSFKKQTISPVFSLPKKSVLSEVVRYGALIGSLGQYYRDMISYVESGGCPVSALHQVRNFMPNWNDGTEMVYFTNNSRWFLESAIADFYKGQLDTRIIAYRNHTIDTNNEVIRPYFFDEVEKYSVGEYIVLNRPYMSNSVHLHNGTVLKIVKTEPEWHEFSVSKPNETSELGEAIPIQLKVWNILATPVNLETGEEKDPVQVVAIHQDSEDDYKDVQDELIKNAKIVGSSGWESLSKLRSENIFSSRYYCMSCYKSQGQSIKNVYVMMNDILDVDQLDALTMLRSLYVAVTRSTSKLIVLI